MLLDSIFCDLLTELVIHCDWRNIICYANLAAQQCSPTALDGQPFLHLLTQDAQAKGERFLAAARAATPEAPTMPWELPMGDTASYKIATFRGYCAGDDLVILGQVEADEISAMHREMLALTSELSEAQREQRRQNRQLQQALDEQRRLIETIQDLTAPAVPVWNHVLLLPLVGQLDSHRANQITSQLLARVEAERATFVILDLSGIAIVDTAVAQQLIHTGQALRLLGVQPILVGINSEIAQTIVGLGIQLSGFNIQSNLQHAMAFVLARSRAS